MARDAGNLTTMIRTWIANDVADGGDLGGTLGRIEARTMIITAITDLYFTPADCKAEAALVPGASYDDIDTNWGHMSGSGQSLRDTDVIDTAMASILES